ncbi:26770_t:CDS:1, partial [Racocetra persica]
SNIRRTTRITDKSRRSWSAKEKLMVINYYEHIKNVRATARRFEIEPKQVCEWLDKKQELLSVAPYILTLNRGRQAQFPLLEERLVEWINKHRKEQNAVTRNMVEKKAKALHKLMNLRIFTLTSVPLNFLKTS